MFMLRNLWSYSEYLAKNCNMRIYKTISLQKNTFHQTVISLLQILHSSSRLFKALLSFLLSEYISDVQSGNMNNAKPVSDQWSTNRPLKDCNNVFEICLFENVMVGVRLNQSRT